VKRPKLTWQSLGKPGASIRIARSTKITHTVSARRQTSATAAATRGPGASKPGNALHPPACNVLQRAVRVQLATISLPAICKRKQTTIGNSYAHPSNSQANARQAGVAGAAVAPQGGLSPRFSFYVATCALLCQPDPPTRVPYSLPGGTSRGHSPRPICAGTPAHSTSRTRQLHLFAGPSGRVRPTVDFP